MNRKARINVLGKQPIRFLPTFICVLLAAAGTAVIAEPIYVFLLAGQSNMSGDARVSGLPAGLKGKQENVIIHLDPATDGDAGRKGKWMTLEPGFGWYGDRFGPELLFGKTFTDKYPDVKLALVKSSVAGTDLAQQWRPPSSGGNAGKLYNGFVKEINNALSSLEAKYTPQIMGLLWMQGEADAMNSSWANDYERNLRNFITDIRTEVEVADMPFIAANIDEQSVWTNYKIVNNAMIKLAGEMENVKTFPTKGFETDRIHYQTNGMIELGKTFGNTYIDAGFFNPGTADTTDTSGTADTSGTVDEGATYVFLLAGQSNMSGMASTGGLPSDLKGKQDNVLIHVDPTMDGASSKKGKWLTLEPGFGYNSSQFGPELAFAAKLTKKYPGVKLALIKSSVSGTDLDKQWRPPSSGGTAGKLYTNFVSEIKTAMGSLENKEKAKIKGMLWMQGEADAMNASMANNYKTNLKNFIEDIRSEVKVDDLPFIAANIDEQSTWANYAIVNNAMNAIAKEMENVMTFPTKGFQTDKIHYQTEGMIDLGEAFADAVIEGKYLEEIVPVAFGSSAARTAIRPMRTIQNTAVLYDLSGRKVPVGNTRRGSNGMVIFMSTVDGRSVYRSAVSLPDHR